MVRLPVVVSTKVAWVTLFNNFRIDFVNIPVLISSIYKSPVLWSKSEWEPWLHFACNKDSFHDCCLRTSWGSIVVKSSITITAILVENPLSWLQDGLLPSSLPLLIFYEDFHPRIGRSFCRPGTQHPWNCSLVLSWKSKLNILNEFRTFFPAVPSRAQVGKKMILTK